MVRCENGLNTRPERPRPRGAKRFITMPLPTKAWATTSSSTSRSWLFSALATAGSRHFLTATADQLRNQVELLRAHPQHPGDRLGLVIGEAPFALWLAHRLILKPNPKP